MSQAPTKEKQDTRYCKVDSRQVETLDPELLSSAGAGIGVLEGNWVSAGLGKVMLYHAQLAVRALNPAPTRAPPPGLRIWVKHTTRKLNLHQVKRSVML